MAHDDGSTRGLNDQIEPDSTSPPAGIHAGQEPDPTTGAVMMPIYATSTYVQQSPGVHKGYDYARTKNPTRMAFESAASPISKAAARGVRLCVRPARRSRRRSNCLDQGSHVVAVDDLYGGSRRLFERVRKRSSGESRSPISICPIPDAIEAAIRPNTRLVWIETPTNPLLKLVDLDARRRHRAKSAASRPPPTIPSPVPMMQRPLEHGFDLVVHSTTKYLNGHSDMVGGVAVVGDNAELGERLEFLQNAVGAIQGPFDLVSGAARPEDAGIAHGAALHSALKIAAGSNATPKYVACSIPGLRAIRSTRSPRNRCTPSGHDLGRTRRHARRCAPISRALPAVRAGRKPRRGRRA